MFPYAGYDKNPLGNVWQISDQMGHTAVIITLVELTGAVLRPRPRELGLQ